MGSWNATCQISQMPIHAGEDVRFLLLVKSPFRMDSSKGDAYSYMEEGQKEEDFGYQPNSATGREGCYPDNFWTPEFVPVRAKYNDYGSVEDIDTKSLNWSIWMDTINKRIVELKQGSNEYYDLSTSKNMKLDQLLDVLREGRLIFDYSWKTYKVPVSQTMIREDVYQAMLKLKIPENPYWEVKGEYNPNVIYKDGLKFFPQEKIEHIKKNIATRSDPEYTAGLRKFYNEHGLNFDKTEDDLKFPMYEFENDRNGTFSFATNEGGGEGLKAYCRWIVNNLVNGKIVLNSKQYKKLIKDIADFMYIRTLYYYLRKTWHPGTGRGSQSSDLKMSADYYENLAKIARHLEKSRNEKYGEDEENDEEN